MLNFTNLSDYANVLEEYHIPSSIKCILLMLYIVIIIIGLPGNLVVCYGFSKKNVSKTVTDILIVTIAVNDILVIVVCVPFSAISNLILYYWPFVSGFCPVLQYVQTTTVLFRSFVLVTLAVEMHLAVWRPFRRRTRRMTIVILFTASLLVSFTLASPTALYSRVSLVTFNSGMKGLCLEIWPLKYTKHIYSVSLMILQYFLPLLIMIGTYWHIAVILWRHVTPGEKDQKRDRRIVTSKRKTVKLLIMMVGSFALAWLPFHTLSVIGDVDPNIYDSESVHVIWLFTHWLSMTNCAVNPVVYYFKKENIRSIVRKILRSLFCHLVCQELVTERRCRRSSNKSQIKYSHNTEGTEMNIVKEQGVL